MTSADSPAADDADAGTQSRPFGHAAFTLWRFGLAVLPVGGGDGKRPLMKWARLRHRPGRKFIDTLVQRFGEKNIGILTGRLSRITVVDCDTPEAVAVMIGRCGDTPLKVRTPSGGAHLYYKWTNERCANLRREGLAVDVKGNGGFVVAPPSVRPSSPHAGKAYEFLTGSWADLCRLPTIRPGGLPKRGDTNTNQRREHTVPTTNEHPPAEINDEHQAIPLCAVREGQRNETLFKSLLPNARRCDDVDALLHAANRINADFELPLTDGEVEKTVKSAWRYQSEGRNWAGQNGTTYVTKTEFALLMGHKRGPDALVLLVRLRLAHWNRATFSISPKAMAEAQVISGWSHCRYRNARAALVELGFLRLTKRGGRRKGDANRYAFAEAAASKGQGSRPNVIKHPPPLSPLSSSSTASDVDSGGGVPVWRRFG